MPPVVIAFALLAAEAITVWAFWMTVVSTAIGEWQASRARRKAKDAYNANLRDRLVSVATTTGYRSVCFGRVRNVDGVLYKATWGPDKRYYTFVVACAGHEVDGFEACYFNDTKLVLDVDNYALTPPYARVDTTTYMASVTIASGVGSVTLPVPPIASTVYGVILQGAGTENVQQAEIVVTSIVGNVLNLACVFDGTTTIWYQTSQLLRLAHVTFHNGAPTQDLSGTLIALGVPGIVSGVHRFAGIACMIVTLAYDVEGYAGGVPQMSAVFRGMKCLDRRTATRVWTQNPAVIADEWSCHPWGGGLDPSEIHEGLLIASANACDVPHAFTSSTVDGPPVTETLPMYTCGIVCRAEAEPTENLSATVESMAGQWGWAGGKLRIKAGFYTAPVATIDESWFSEKGSRHFNQGLPQAELVNIYEPQIADAAQNYTVQPVASVRADAYITSDGAELPRPITLEGVTDVVHAQHVCGVLIRESRQGFTCELPCNFKGLRVELFDNVALNLDRYGIVAKVMQIVTWAFSQEGGTRLVLKETAAGNFDPDAGFALLDEQPNTNLPLPWVVPIVTGVAVTSGIAVLEDASIVTRTRVTWDEVPSASVLQSGHIEIAYLELLQTASEWQTIEELGTAVETTIVGLKAGSYYIFKVRARNTLNIRGTWTYHIVHRIAAPPPGGTTDVTLIARGDCVLVGGNTGKKTGLSSAWNSDIYSADAYTGGAFASALAPASFTTQILFGLNSDPTFDMSWASIDFAWYILNSQLEVYESGVHVSLGLPFTAGDVLAVVYDGTSVRYLQNGIVRRTVTATAGLKLYFDSSFSTPGAVLRNIRFGPMTDVSGALAAANAAAAAAATAQAAAVAALAELGVLASDNVLSAVEKPAVILDVQAISDANAGIAAQATAFSITTELTAYATAYAALISYLATLTTPVAWNNLTGQTTIVGTTFRTKFGDVYASRQILLNKIADVAATRATWAGVSSVDVTTTQIHVNAATDVLSTPVATQSYTVLSSDPTQFDLVLASVSYSNPLAEALAVEVTGGASHHLFADTGSNQVNGWTFVEANIGGAGYTLISAIAYSEIVGAGNTKPWLSSFDGLISLPALTSVTARLVCTLQADPAGGPGNGFGTASQLDTEKALVKLAVIKR